MEKNGTLTKESRLTETDFQKIAKKYGVDFAVVKDKNVNPPVYTIFFKAKDMDAVTFGIRCVQYDRGNHRNPAGGKGIG